MNPFKVRRGRRSSLNGEVSNMQLKRDCERGIEYFYSKRPWLRAPVPSFGPGRRVLRARLGLDEAVRVAVAIGQPMRGALKAIAVSNGLDYAEFMKAYYRAKRTGVLPGEAEKPKPVVEDALGRVARELVERGALPVGAIKAEALQHGLNYNSLMTRLVRLRAKLAAVDRRACA